MSTEMSIKVKVSARFPYSIDSKGNSTSYDRTYCLKWEDRPSQQLELCEGYTLQDISNALSKLQKVEGSDCTRYELSTEIALFNVRQRIDFSHDIDIDMHTYISKDSSVRVQYYSNLSDNLVPLLSAAIDQGVTLTLTDIKYS